MRQVPAIARATDGNAKAIYYTGQLGSRNLPGGCAPSRRPDGGLPRPIAGRLRARSETRSGIAFATRICGAGLPRAGSAFSFLGNGSSLPRADSAAPWRRFLGFRYG